MGESKSRKQVCDQGHTILNKLVNVCLLEEVGEDFVKMHDLIRDMALRITSGRSSLMLSTNVPKFMVKAGFRLNEIPDEKDWTADLEAVSLMGNEKMLEISPNISPNCPKLSTLILNGTSLRSIPDSFFEHMSGLKVLDLSHTEIKELPNCVSDMVKLTTLLLTFCEELSSVPPLGKLKDLRELNLEGTFIGEVPQGLETLTKLEFLNMWDTNVKKIPEGTLSRLSHLQSLWVSGFVPNEDVRGLKQLERFYGGIVGITAYNDIMRSLRVTLDSYYIIVEGCPKDRDYRINNPFQLMMLGKSDCGPGLKRLHLSNCKFGNNEVSLPGDIEELSIWKYSVSGSCLSDVFSKWNSCTRNLLKLELEEADIEFLFRVSTSDEQQDSSCVPPLPLKTLSLQGLKNLDGLIKPGPDAAGPGCLSPGTFSQLRELTILSCVKLKTIFTLPLLQNLQNLEYFWVGCFEKLEEIILSVDNETEGGVEGTSISSRSTTDVILPKLKRLILDCLPELKSIYNGTMICDSLLCTAIKGCPKLRRLPLSLSSVQSLEDVRGSGKEWWESLEWDDPSAKNALLPKFEDGWPWHLEVFL